MTAVSITFAPFYFSEEIDVYTRADGTEHTVRTISPIARWVVPIAILLIFPIGFFSWIWAGRVIRPLVQITQTATDIQTGSLDKRIHLPNALSEIETLARQFNLMMDRLAQESQIQTQLIENTSHEIRTPLAVLATNAEVMLADPTPSQESYRASTELTAKTVSRLRTTVEELLNGATFSSLKFKQCDNDLVGVVKRVVDSYSHIAQNKEISLVMEAPTSLLCAFEGRSVERALSNLLDNAIRFSTTRADVNISVGIRDERAFASVEDFGPGIDEEIRLHLFDWYVSDSNPTSGNLGIGLAIVKQVADAHRGITIDSPIEGDLGSRFTMWFEL